MDRTTPRHGGAETRRCGDGWFSSQSFPSPFMERGRGEVTTWTTRDDQVEPSGRGKSLIINHQSPIRNPTSFGRCSLTDKSLFFMIVHRLILNSVLRSDHSN
jgi:hypothetical protein